jgi:hypothetical protein
MELHATVAKFFHDAVTEAMKSQRVEATEPTEFYLVNLLVEFTHAPVDDGEPLALKMAQVANANLDERVRGLKDIGDRSLYMSGFFGESLSRKLVDVDYYIAMGGSAYAQLARLIGGRGSQTFPEVYRELAVKFSRFVEVLNEIRRNTTLASGGTNLVKLCEEWVRTGSEMLERRLRETGVVSLEGVTPGKKLIH